MAEKITPDFASKYDVDWLGRRITDLDKKVRILIDVLLDQKVLTPELAKVFSETKDNKVSAEVLKWYLDKSHKASK